MNYGDLTESQKAAREELRRLSLNSKTGEVRLNEADYWRLLDEVPPVLRWKKGALENIEHFTYGRFGPVFILDVEATTPPAAP